jgi:hypothetical protein
MRLERIQGTYPSRRQAGDVDPSMQSAPRRRSAEQLHQTQRVQPRLSPAAQYFATEWSTLEMVGQPTPPESLRAETSTGSPVTDGLLEAPAPRRFVGSA